MGFNTISACLQNSLESSILKMVLILHILMLPGPKVLQVAYTCMHTQPLPKTLKPSTQSWIFYMSSLWLQYSLVIHLIYGTHSSICKDSANTVEFCCHSSSCAELCLIASQHFFCGLLKFCQSATGLQSSPLKLMQRFLLTSAGHQIMYSYFS